MCFGSDVSGSLHELEFFRSLDDAQFVNDGGGIDDRLRGMDRFPIQATHRRDLANDLFVEILLHPEAVIQHLSSVQNFAQLAVKLLNWKRLLRAEFALRTFDARATPVPNLTFRIARPDKQDILVRLAGPDDRDRVGLFKTGQVEKIRILAKAVMSVVGARCFARGGNDGDGVGLHTTPELRELRSNHPRPSSCGWNKLDLHCTRPVWSAETLLLA